ncbi:exo 1,3/1,4-beta-D-glucan glucohydrolase [Sphingopyxis indica]|uniref:glycoside hydrolase family 3 protein n=1 Tax=Sphingopyxis indica TaxID=436663 RepID=UPI002B2DDE72|nr:exo 1,3/1,4-beta-D-glucan glucohydrolase [Sphingopyxis indica]
MWLNRAQTAFLGASLSAATLAFAASAGAEQTPPGVANPALWPTAKSQGLIDSKTEARVTALLRRMSIEEKVGQMIQADTASVTPEDLRKYPLGSILAGGSSPPMGAPDRSPAGPWIETARAFNAVAMERRPGHVPIPIMFGIDAVHGNNNVVGATLFPHNSALGAAHDPDLIRRIGEATARETAAAGIDWAFAPTLAVPRNDRWGRTYEGYSEDPELVRAYAAKMIEGLQGAPGKGTLQQGHVSASAKHFLGDGGTTNGIDQGNTEIPESELIAIHSAGYPPAINAGTRTIMASFNSWQGVKMHGNKSLLTDVLKGRMGFDGFIVGDWNGHGQVPGCTTTDCPVAFNAGLDMAMAPDSWKGLFENTVKQVREGVIPMARVDDAVRRILRVKFKAGLFDPARPFESRIDVIGSPAHRALAREAVRKSLVLLKNNGALPVKSSAHILVAGNAADNISQQSGGWTLSWQGDGNTNADFPNAQSIYAGIAEAMKAGGGSATLSVDGSFTEKPDLAIVVFGEQPYAEGLGDLRTLEFEAGDKKSLALLKKLKSAGIPVVSVFLSGRPVWVNPELNQSDAFVAAWLPGSEGGGIADVLIGDAQGRPGKDFTGRLSFSWPKTAAQFTLNKGQTGYDPLFALGYGLGYAAPGVVGRLSEVAGIDATATNKSRYFTDGRIQAPFSLTLGAGVTRRPVDSPSRQEGAIQLGWTAGQAAKASIEGDKVDLRFETNAEMMLQMTYRVDTPATGRVNLSMGGGTVDATDLFQRSAGWRTVRIPLKCFADKGADMTGLYPLWTLSATDSLTVSFADIGLATQAPGGICPPTP